MASPLRTNEICDDICRELDYDKTALQNFGISVKGKLLSDKKQVLEKVF